MAFFPSLPAVTYAKDTPLCKAPLAVRHILETEGPDVIKANYITIDEFTSDGCGMVSSILRLITQEAFSIAPKVCQAEPAWPSGIQMGGDHITEDRQEGDEGQKGDAGQEVTDLPASAVATRLAHTIQRQP